MTEEATTSKRGSRLVGLLAGALALGVIPFAFPASSQMGTEPEVREITDACPPDDVPDSAFTDIDGTTFEAEITCVEWYEITRGVTRTTYVPLGTVSRAQMATFIANLIDYVDPGALDGVSDDTDAFPCASARDELVPTDTHYNNIQRLADAEIVRGGPAGRPADCYGPDLPVSRGQMASFIAQAQEFLGEPISGEGVAAAQLTTTTTANVTTTTTANVTTTTTANVTTTTTAGATTTTTAAGGGSGFFDDDDDSVHEANIELIASEGIAVGTSENKFQPGANIRRGQMAAFLARKLDYLVDADDTTPPPTTTTTT